MSIVGQVESLWRYPIKSMAGEALAEAFFGYAGVYGDRAYAFLHSRGPPGFPYLTGAGAPADAAVPAALPQRRGGGDAAQSRGRRTSSPSCRRSIRSMSELEVEVATPSGQVLAADDPALLAMLAGDQPPPGLSLIRSHRAMTDARPVSLISLKPSVNSATRSAIALDKRRFRANIYAQLGTAQGFGEAAFVGRRLQIGHRVIVAVLDQDARCKMITIDPDTAEETPNIMRNVARAHGGNAGVYCAVLIEGVVRPGDPIVLLD